MQNSREKLEKIIGEKVRDALLKLWNSHHTFLMKSRRIEAVADSENYDEGWIWNMERNKIQRSQKILEKSLIKRNLDKSNELKEC